MSAKCFDGEQSSMNNALYPLMENIDYPVRQALSISKFLSVTVSSAFGGINMKGVVKPYKCKTGCGEKGHPPGCPAISCLLTLPHHYRSIKGD